MNKKDMETFIVNKWTQAPVPELVFDAAASVETGPDAATVLPVSLKSARRSRRGVAAIAAAAAVVLVVAAALAVWKLPDALPALWGGTSETSTSTASTTGGKPTLPSAAGSTSSQTEAPVKEEPVIDLEAIKAEIEKSGAYEDFHIKARYVDVEGHFTRKDVLQTASFLFYMEDGMGSGGDVWYYLMIETPGEDTLQIRCLDNLGGNINVYSIRDFTGDGLDEIVLLSYGKGEDITILSVSGGVARPLFFTYEMDRDSLERNFGFTVEFFADYRAVLRNQYVDYEQIIDFSPW